MVAQVLVALGAPVLGALEVKVQVQEAKAHLLALEAKAHLLALEQVPAARALVVLGAPAAQVVLPQR